MSNLTRVAAAMVLLCVSPVGAQAASRLATDPACQIIFQPAGRLPVRAEPMVWPAGNPGKPLAYRDSETKILFYGESDGRHLAAIGSDGKLLWFRNPFDDSGLCPYRNARPVLRDIRAADPLRVEGYRGLHGAKLNAHDRYISIAFDSSQFGLVSQRTGDFFFEGQN